MNLKSGTTVQRKEVDEKCVETTKTYKKY